MTISPARRTRFWLRYCESWSHVRFRTTRAAEKRWRDSSFTYCTYRGICSLCWKTQNKTQYHHEDHSGKTLLRLSSVVLIGRKGSCSSSTYETNESYSVTLVHVHWFTVLIFMEWRFNADFRWKHSYLEKELKTNRGVLRIITTVSGLNAWKKLLLVLRAI